MKSFIEKLSSILGRIINRTRGLLSSLSSHRGLSLGFLYYTLAGVALLSLPFAQKTHVGFIDNLFNVVSAISTTGLSTACISDLYSVFGLIVILLLMQLGGIGYMTLTSFIILSRFNALSYKRVRILSIEFPLPEGMKISEFVRHIIVYSFIVELLGTFFLWREFSAASVENPLWSAFFHSVSSFATAGFSLFPNSFEGFSGNIGVNITVSLLCYAGAIGFIVPLDIYKRITGKSKSITFTTKIILFISALVLIIASVFSYFASECTFTQSLFQIMNASTTAGFNSVPIGALPHAVIFVVILVMIIGASPSGTGGGVKTTSVSVLIAIVSTLLRGEKEKISLYGNIIPYNRIFTAVASISAYMFFLFIIILALLCTETIGFLELSFEAASALGTVGLSMGITGNLSDMGKLIITLAMFSGRVGLLAIGLSIFSRKASVASESKDLVV